MVSIISHHASRGLMLPRSAGALAAALDSYLVADADGRIVGCGGLDRYSQESAEICGLATASEDSPPWHRQNHC